MTAGLTRRRFLAGAAAAAATAVTAGCGSGGKTELAIMGNNPAEITDQDIAEFEKAHPDVKIKMLPVDTTLLTAMFAAGNAPDVVRDQGVPNTPYLVARDLVLNLDPYFAKSTVLAPDKLAKADDVWRYDGREQGKGPRYGLVKDYSQDGMFWCNTAPFEKANVDVPSTAEPLTYDEWLDLGQKLTNRHGAQYQVYGLDPPFDVSITAGFLNMITSAGGSIFNDDFTTVDFSAPEPISALEWYLKFAKLASGPTVARPLPAGAFPTFSSNKLAMLGYGYWFSGQIATDDKLQEHVQFMPAPRFGKTRTSPCFSGTGHWIPKTAKHKDAAWAFFEHYFGGPPAVRRAESGWGLPGIKALEKKLPNAKKYQKQSLKVQDAEFEYYSVLKFSPYLSISALDSSLSQTLVKGLEGNWTGGRLADAINNTLNPLMKLGKELIG